MSARSYAVVVFMWHRWQRNIKGRLRNLLPGIISGGADNDPAGISTYAISGARFGYQQLWLMIVATPMLIAVQAMCARLGNVKRKGLMAIIKDHFPLPLVYVAMAILIITNIATLGADLSAVASAIGLITNTDFSWWVIPAALVILFIVVFSNYRVMEKYLFLLTFVFLAYIAATFLAQPDWGEVIRSIVWPKIELKPEYLVVTLGLLGTTITPFLFFWQSKQELEEKKSEKQLIQEATKEDEIILPGFAYSNLISIFIMISTGAVLHKNGITEIKDAGMAAQALAPLAGSWAKYLFAIGIIGSGLLAIPILATSTAYVVAEVWGWRDSLSDKFNRARGFYLVISIAVFLGVVIALSGIEPMTAILYSQVLNGILAPVLILMILWLCNSKSVMGNLTNNRFDNLFGGFTVLVMGGSAFGLIWQLIR